MEYGRDSSVVNLEMHWERGNTFEKFVRLVSDKRARHVPLDFDINLHRDLSNNVVTAHGKQDLQKATNKIKKKIYKSARDTHAYDNWIERLEQSEESDYDSMISWRTLEIEIAREKDRMQTRLLDIPLENKQENTGSNLIPMSKFFIHRELGMPYYFGFSQIAAMSTYNIEMFLKMAAEMFDEIWSQRINDRKDDTLAAPRQEEIIKEIARKYFDQIPQTDENGRDVTTFLSSFQQWARNETMRPTAPYPPGITGIGISYECYEHMMTSYLKSDDQAYKRLINVLRSCIVHNYMSVRYDARQGRPDSRVVVFYLNRLLCAHFDLPLGRGGWRHKKLDELCRWLEPSADATDVGGGKRS